MLQIINLELVLCKTRNQWPITAKSLIAHRKTIQQRDKKLLSIVMTLKEFQSMLLGAVINIHIDHKNILILGDSSQRRLRWISHVDEYGPTLHYIKGPSNVIADTFLCMPMKNTTPLIMVGKEEPTADPISQSPMTRK